jgi:hypothetical protein
MRPARAAVAAVVLLLSAAVAFPVHSQVVTGRLMDAGANRPIASAFVQLEDSAGVRHAGALTDSMGRFALRARASGMYRLRAERLGYETVTSPALRLGATPLDYVFELNPRALVLPAVDAHSEDSRGCQRRPDGRAVVALWEAVRTALNVASWTGETRSIRFSMMNHVREYDPSLRTVEHEELTPSYSTAAIPYSAVSPDVLARDGYLEADGETSWLLGIDADVLLSESFLNSHCFRIVGSPDRNRVGLGFMPLRGDERTDVSGALWVDRRTTELQYLEFEYEGLPDHLRRFGAGGQVHFERLSSGAWIVTRWWIRAARVGAQRGSRRYRLLGYREDGGTITSADAIDTGLYDLRGSGVIEGTVHDSVTNLPMPDALIFLSGKPFSAVSDADGRYRMERVPRGEHAIGFTHPLLEELGVPQRLDTVSISRDAVLLRNFASPSMTSMLRAICPGEPEEPTTGLLYGFVRSPATGEPLAGVEVRASWKGPPRVSSGMDSASNVDRRRTVETGSDGRYAVCWLPADREAQLHVDSREVRHRDVKVQLSSEPIQRQDFMNE